MESDVDFLSTSIRRKILFTALYLSEGAPIGFLWLALPTRLREAGAPLDEITSLTALLVIPWTFKFLWAPVIDVLRTERWTLRNWIVCAQTLMGLTLLPLFWIDPHTQFEWMKLTLLIHAFAAATQDVAIDGLCIAVTSPAERGQYNGWMQAGMLLGRACMGGGALVLSQFLGDDVVVGMLIGLTTFSMLLVLGSRLPPDAAEKSIGSMSEMAAMLKRMFASRTMWLGLLFGLFGGASFKSFEIIYGPFLIDRGYSKLDIGWFSAGPMIISMIIGSLIGGWLADKIERKRFVAYASLFIVAAISAFALADRHFGGSQGLHLWIGLAAAAVGIGLFTAASYALFMDLTNPKIAATQFSAFMGSTNGCESWSSYAIGQIIVLHGYAAGMLTMCGVSAVALLLLAAIDPLRDER